MKVFKKVLVTLLIIGGVVTLWLLKDKILDTLLAQRADAKAQEAQEIIDQKAKEETLKTIEENRIRNISQRELISGEIHKSDKLPVLENTAVWKNAIPKSGFIQWCNNVMHIEVPYQWQIQYDTTKMQILHINNGVAYIKINLAKENFVPFVLLKAQEIKIELDNESFLVVGFDYIDMKDTLAIAEKDINELICTEENYNMAVNNLKDKVVEVVHGFGYEVQFIEE